MGECCTYCLKFYRNSISRDWGRSNRVVKIPGCPRCVIRHETELDKLKADFETKKEFYETELSKSAQDFLTQKTMYEELVSKLRLNSSIEVNKLKADNEEQRSKVKFLQVIRDSSQQDVVLEAPGLKLSAHRAILAARSPVFQQIFCSGIAENPPRVIKVEDISPPVLEEIIDFCYAGEFTFSELVRPDEVLKVAHTFELARLKELCDIELCGRVTVDNVPEMLKLSRKFSAIKLGEEAGKVFKDHFDILKDKVYGALEGPDTVTNSISDGD